GKPSPRGNADPPSLPRRSADELNDSPRRCGLMAGGRCHRSEICLLGLEPLATRSRRPWPPLSFELPRLISLSLSSRAATGRLLVDLRPLQRRLIPHPTGASLLHHGGSLAAQPAPPLLHGGRPSSGGSGDS
ncbi:hypothetical protein BRADI_3g43857v3, partial [Brachypodium distachyon]